MSAVTLPGGSLSLLAPHAPFGAALDRSLGEGRAMGSVAGREGVGGLSGGGVGPALPGSKTGERDGAVGFEDYLRNAFGAANAQIQAASRAGDAFAAGTLDDIHGTMISLKQADIELRLMSNVRNKLLDAFYELWRMNV
jgi:flagellar hook-basal body complex protein FliE